MNDPYHQAAVGETTVNYNRDIEVFPVLQAILSRVAADREDGASLQYRSPTEMGVNMLGYCITDDEIIRAAAKQEIIRRLFRARCDRKLGRIGPEAAGKIELIMSQLGLSESDRSVVAPALDKAREKGSPAVAIRLPYGGLDDSTGFAAGRETGLMSATASAVINAIKRLGGIQDDILLISRHTLEPVQKLKETNFGERRHTLGLEEVLICLSISAPNNPTAEHALKMLPALRGCEAHATYMVSDADERAMHKLGVNLTCEPEFAGKDLYYE
jgi:uncharacterized protein (UPF0371 family)